MKAVTVKPGWYRVNNVILVEADNAAHACAKVIRAMINQLHVVSDAHRSAPSTNIWPDRGASIGNGAGHGKR